MIGIMILAASASILSKDAFILGTEIPIKLKQRKSFVITVDHYPAKARAAGIEGEAKVRLTIGRDGKISDCLVITSSNSPDLDNQTCQIGYRFDFQPPTDASGSGVEATSDLMIAWGIGRPLPKAATGERLFIMAPAQRRR